MEKAVKENSLQPSKGKLFWRIQKECWRRMITPYLMYLFMSLLMLATQAINITWLKIMLGTVCLLGAMAYNAHLTYCYGKMHFDSYLTGCLHRRNAALGIVSGGDHSVEKEYRPWKGFYIGFLVGIPVIIFGALAGAFYEGMGGSIAGVLLIMFAGWAVIPISWLRGPLGTIISFYWSILMIIIPILVSGIFYIIGAKVEQRRKEQETERAAAVAELSKKAQEAQKERVYREQTEEQRRKTLQSKKKKK